MNHPCQTRTMSTERRGALLPAIAFALLVVGAASALVLNRLWIDAAEVELHNAAEASALAAAGYYLDDHLLIPKIDPEIIISHAKERAAQVAATNLVGGQPVQLNTAGEDTDIVFGRRIATDFDGETTFLLTNKNPTVVEVRTRRSREHGNPIALFYPGTTGHYHAEASMIVEAAFDNLIDHFSAANGRAIPALPLAILAADITGERNDTWAYMIEGGNGNDQYQFDPVTRQVVKQPDGIPEIRLQSVPLKTDPHYSNVQLLDFGNQLADQKLIKQIRNGLTATDLTRWQNRLPAQSPIAMTGSANIPTPLQLEFEKLIGQQKIVMLYHSAQPFDVPGWSNLVCEKVVAIRILDVIPESGESATLVVQPTVLTTTSAVLAKYLNEYTQPKTPVAPNVVDIPVPQIYAPNKYIYKLYVSR